MGFISHNLYAELLYCHIAKPRSQTCFGLSVVYSLKIMEKNEIKPLIAVVKPNESNVISVYVFR